VLDLDGRWFIARYSIEAVQVNLIGAWKKGLEPCCGSQTSWAGRAWFTYARKSKSFKDADYA
jgi:hypothetical protein